MGHLALQEGLVRLELQVPSVLQDPRVREVPGLEGQGHLESQEPLDRLVCLV